MRGTGALRGVSENERGRDSGQFIRAEVGLLLVRGIGGRRGYPKRPKMHLRTKILINLLEVRLPIGTKDINPKILCLLNIGRLRYLGF